VCQTPGQLHVRHQDADPDRMVCAACGTEFEAEASGPRIRLVMAPPALAGTPGLIGVWMSTQAVRALADQALAAGAKPAEPPAPPPPPNSRPPPQTAAPPANPGKGCHGAGDAEPGSEDWYATLASVIGGLAPPRPPSDNVLADELERALATRPPADANGASEP